MKKESMEAPCGECGTVFKTKASRIKKNEGKFCSQKCANENRKKRKSSVKKCKECSNEFRVTPCTQSHDFCCAKCRYAYFLRDRNPVWKGGTTHSENRLRRRIDRENHKSPYEAETRLVAARVIGREIDRSEVVICLNQNSEDCRPENLFIIPNRSEWMRVQMGMVEWPSKSNLEDYKLFGYVVPLVRLVLHKWQNGKRVREGNIRKRSISRHPQADEIILRRKSGATIKQLAEVFGGSDQAMCYILKNHL